MRAVDGEAEIDLVVPLEKANEIEFRAFVLTLVFELVRKLEPQRSKVRKAGRD